ncbi:unnamed protein product [Closterium sp. NIES-53]
MFISSPRSPHWLLPPLSRTFPHLSIPSSPLPSPPLPSTLPPARPLLLPASPSCLHHGISLVPFPCLLSRLSGFESAIYFAGQPLPSLPLPPHFTAGNNTCCVHAAAPPRGYQFLPSPTDDDLPQVLPPELSQGYHHSCQPPNSQLTPQELPSPPPPPPPPAAAPGHPMHLHPSHIPPRPLCQRPPHLPPTAAFQMPSASPALQLLLPPASLAAQGLVATTGDCAMDWNADGPTFPASYPPSIPPSAPFFPSVPPSFPPSYLPSYLATYQPTPAPAYQPPYPPSYTSYPPSVLPSVATGAAAIAHNAHLTGGTLTWDMSTTFPVYDLNTPPAPPPRPQM